MPHLLLAFCLFFLPLTLTLAQSPDETPNGLQHLQMMRNTTPRGQAPPPGTVGNIIGTPYLYDNFQEGIVLLSNGQRVPTLVNYDLVNHEVLAELNSVPMALPYQNVDAFFVITPKRDTLIFKPVNDIPEGKSLELGPAAFVQVLHEGNLTLIAHHRKNFLATTNQTTYNNGRQEPEYNEQPTRYYLITEGKEVERLKLRYGWLKRYFQEYRSGVKEYISETKPDLNTVEGMTAVVQWLDTAR